MARKILNKNSPGTSTTWAADDWDYLNKYLTDVDQTAIDPVSIKTNTSFWDNRLRVWNPAKTKSYRIRGLAIVNDYDLTLPLLSSNDEIVGLLTTQTLQNKQINVNNNTLKHGTTNAIGDLLVGTGTKYDRFAMGSTGGYVLAVKNDLTGLEWVAAAGGGGGEANTASNVGTAGASIFKQKSGVDLQFKKLFGPSSTLITVTDDAANSKIDFKLTGGTDGQFLKSVGNVPTWSTLAGQYGRVMPDSSQYAGARYGSFLGGATDGEGLFGGLYTEGTISSQISTAVTRTRFTSAAADASLGGFSTWSYITRRQQTPRFKIRFSTSTSTERLFAGFISEETFPIGTLNPLINKHGAGIAYNDEDANFLARWNNGNAIPQAAATAVAKNTSVHTAEILLDEASTSVSIWFDGTQIVNASTIQAPAQTTGLAIHAWNEAFGATATGLEVEYAMITFP